MTELVLVKTPGGALAPADEEARALVDVSTPSHQGMFATVDAADFEELNQWKWSAEKRGGTFYAIRCVRGTSGKKTTIRMHRQIVNAPEGCEVDHADGNCLHNRRENLRACSVAENQQNRSSVRGASRYKGVLLDRSHGFWKAKIIVNGKRLMLGSFQTEDAAARRYDQAAKAHFGEFARLNFPGEECEAVPASVVERGERKLPRGVSLKESGKFSAKKRVAGKDYYIGTFDTAEDAERAYQEFRP